MAQEVAPQMPIGTVPVERDLKAGEFHSYRIDLAAGEMLRATVDQRGIDVVVRVYAPDGKRLAEIDSPNGDQGPEPVEIKPQVAGAYRIEVGSLDPASPPGKYQIKIDEHLTAAAYAARLAAELRQRTETIAWLKHNAIPIKTVEAGNGFADLQPLKRILRDVRLVGLGEETHGTREFFQFKHRMVEFLVREMGFRVFAIEASYAGCRNINDYIQGRTTDGAGALASQAFWTWNTEEVRAMMEWMRAYNATAPPDQKLKFVGFDLQWNREARDTVLAYLKRVVPERADGFAALTLPQAFNASDAEVATSLETVTEAAVGGAPEVKAAALKKVNEIRTAYQELIGFLTVNETKFALKTSAAEFADALHSARMVPQYLDAYLVPIPPGPQDLALRDLHMAENMARFVAAEPAGTRFIIWAHNFHVGSPVDSPYRFGARLRALYGAQYYNVGFSFGEGGFQSRSFAGPKPTRALTGFQVGPPPEGSLDWYLGQTGSKLFWVDLRHAPATGPVAEWARSPLPMRSIGSIYAPEGVAGYYSPIVPRQEFDGLFYIDKTTRARPNSGIKNVAPVTE
jgi:erythromycin esterase